MLDTTSLVKTDLSSQKTAGDDSADLDPLDKKEPSTESLGERLLCIMEKFSATRERSLELIADLGAEDCNLQSMPDVSPLKWHLAHTTWFFETFIYHNPTFIFSKEEGQHRPAVSPEEYKYLFNSYYNAIGKQYPRAQRSLISRPVLTDIIDYRTRVDHALGLIADEAFAAVRCQRVERGADTHKKVVKLIERIELGIHHEMQHQELMLMDIKHALSKNPLYPALPRLNDLDSYNHSAQIKEKVIFQSTDTQIGHRKREQFCFDNELPPHKVHIPSFALQSRLVSNREFIEFIEAGGYENPALWLSDGWAWIQKNNIECPEYWCTDNGSKNFEVYNFKGRTKLKLDDPLSHISYFEAQAYASFQGARLPTEQEWEYAIGARPESFKDAYYLWQWTNSAYLAYPGFKPFEEEAGEYNGKFMCGQFVLRGGSFATPPSHTRASYRNFFYPHQRWIYSGIRLAFDV